MKDHDSELLISLYFNGNGLMTQEDFDNLSAWIREDQEHARLFIRAGFIHQFIHDSLSGDDLQKNANLELDEYGFFRKDLWKALFVQEQMAPEVELTIEKPEVNVSEEPKEPVVSKQSQKSNKVSLFVAIVSVAVLFLFIAYAHINPGINREEVAEITDSLGAH